MTIIDIDIFGNEDSAGNPIEYFDDDAISNALRLWLSSKKGEFLLEPTKGGILDTSLFKSMSEEQAELLEFSIRTEIQREFIPDIEVTGIAVIPNYTDRLWEIDITFINPFTNREQDVTVLTKDLTQKLSFEYETVEYIGLNLYNWVKIKYPDMSGKLLIYDYEREVWKWGKYLLSNLLQTDPYFSDILQYING